MVSATTSAMVSATVSATTSAMISAMLSATVSAMVSDCGGLPLSASVVCSTWKVTSTMSSSQTDLKPGLICTCMQKVLLCVHVDYCLLCT